MVVSAKHIYIYKYIYIHIFEYSINFVSPSAREKVEKLMDATHSSTKGPVPAFAASHAKDAAVAGGRIFAGRARIVM